MVSLLGLRGVKLESVSEYTYGVYRTERTAGQIKLFKTRSLRNTSDDHDFTEMLTACEIVCLLCQSGGFHTTLTFVSSEFANSL